MKNLARELAALSPAERELLELTLQEKGIEISHLQILPRSAERPHYPLSFPQERMWFIHQLEPESSAYHVAIPLRVRGKLEIPALARALDALVDRHEVLRTTFSTSGGEPVQIVHEHSRRVLPIVDLEILGDSDREREAARVATVLTRRPFDLERDALCRVSLVRLAAEDHAFLPVMHHLISDGWSMGIFFRELLAAYEALRQGRPSPLEPLAIQYVDFALWQRRYLTGQVKEDLLRYWTHQLEGLPPSFELPFDRPRPRVPSYRGESVRVVLPAALVERVRETCRHQGSTLFVALLAAFQAALWRSSGQEDVVVGAPIAHRTRQEVEDLIGFFVNTVVLRGDLSGNPSFRTVLERTRAVNAGANAHQELPFECLVDALQPDRTLNQMPLYQVAFAFQTEPGRGLEVPGLRLREQPASNPVIHTDLTLALTDGPAGVVGGLLYSVDLFDDTTVRRLASRFRRLVEAVLEDLDRPLAELEPWTAAERHQLAVEWNGRGSDERAGPGPALVHEVFDARAAEYPERVALVHEGSAISYRELEVRAGRLARRLRQLGVGAESPVGVCLERSPRVIVSLLAILKAGGAFLPLDRAQPRDRLAFVVEDGSVDWVITEGSGYEELADLGARLVSAGGEALGGDGRPPRTGDGSATAAHPSSPAYVIYTSGSTGRPKGVVIPHRALVDRIADVAGRGERDADTTALHKASLSFDVAVGEIFQTLSTGARLVIARDGGERDPQYLTQLIVERRINFLGFSPQQLEILLAHSGSASWGHVERVATGGETVPPELAQRLHARLPAARIENRYGPTETTISVTSWTFPRDWRAPAKSPIGRPFPRARAYVLDRTLRPAPLGVAGELCIGGAYLARCYLGRPRRTAERFVPDPLAARPGARLYRTGDLAGWRTDGALDFLGRIDHQVKIRGFRIELGEIEAVLGAHPDVHEAAVVDLVKGGARVLAGYFVPRSGSGLSEADLREHLRGEVPEYMVPAAWKELDALPRLPSGKVDRSALPAPEPAPAGGDLPMPPRNAVEETVAEVWREVLEVQWVGADDNFFDLGGHSLLLVKVQSRLQELFERDVTIVDLFRYPTVAALGGFLAPRGEGESEAIRGRQRGERRQGSSASGDKELAIVGMTCRFPGARDVEQFWCNLRDGVESIRFFTPDELVAAGVDPGLAAAPNYVAAHGVLDDVEAFDAPLFGFSPREAQITDPQQRLFLECAWEVLEKAGYDPETYEGAIGVFGGVGASHHWVQLLMSPIGHAVGELRLALGNEKDFLPTQTAYRLGLRGPSVNVQTACSTSLVALHLACQSVLHGECEMALAGGVSAATARPPGYLYEEGGVSSPDGHTRSFDAAAQGTVAGHGVGIVLVKRLSDALAAGDPVRAVIKGSAINNDGSFKMGFTAPSISGQAQVIAEAQTVAGVEPASVGLVEAHGSATPLGDPIEVAALTEVFGSAGGRRCALGSVKTNFGHLNTAAGVAGLIKAVLALEHRQIPPSLHFDRPNPEIDFESSPFFVNTELADWPLAGGPLRAGVSSFGLGGTNAHVVLEEAPPAPPSGSSRPWQLVVQSAATETALDVLSNRLAEYLAAHRDAPLADVAHTLQAGRRRLPFRQALVCRSPKDAVEILGERHPVRLLRGSEQRKERTVAFLFSGLGDHYVGMGRELYESEPSFRREIDRCAELLRPHLDLDLRDVLYPDAGSGGAEGREPGGGTTGSVDLRRLLGRSSEPPAAGDGLLDRTRLAQPAVFVVEYALARLWTEWGVRPEAMIGYSLGEYTAACLAGVFSLEDALALVADRARWIDELPEGIMLAVPLPADDLEPLLPEALSVAAYNGPAVTVVAGPEEAVAALEGQLEEREVVSRRLRSPHAFHSSMMAPIADRLAERVRRIRLRRPRIPYLSNVTGTWISGRDATDPEYWVRHLRQPVRFAQGIEELLGGTADHVLLEVGPGQALGTSARQHPACSPERSVYGSLRDGRDRQSDLAFLLGTLGKLWIDGAVIDWRGFSQHEKRRRLELPTYPFEHRRYGVEARLPATPARGKLPDVADWFYVPSWKLSPPVEALRPPRAGEAASWLVFVDACGLGDKVASRLADAGHDVVRVRPGTAFARLDDGRYEIAPERREDYLELVRDLEAGGRAPGRIAHFWSVTAEPAVGEEAFEATQELGLYSLFSLVQALLRGNTRWPLAVTMVSNGAMAAAGDEPLEPAKATVLGALRVIPQEYPEIPCRALDVELARPGSWQERELVEQLAAELAAGSPELAVAHRRSGRFVQRFEAVKIPEDVAALPRLRRGGVYLVTGGLGRIGMRIAAYLAREFEARLVLTGRSPFPERQRWGRGGPEGGAAGSSSSSDLDRKAEILRALEDTGAEVLVVTADVADREAMGEAVRRARERFGAIHGVFHLAGTIDESVRTPVERVDRDVCRRQFRPKVRGLHVLEEVLGDEELDFCAVFSSLATVLGGLGFGAYAAANAYMDAFAHRHNRRHRVPWVAGDWDGWPASLLDLEMAADRGDDPRDQEGAMDPDEAIEALRRLLVLRGFPQVVVSTAELQPRIDDWLKGAPEAGEAGAAETAGMPRGERPALKTPFVAASSETEERIADVWQDVLGIDSIGVHDNFFELGGDSLLATQVASRLRRVLKVELPLRVFFDAPTVADLAREAGREEHVQEELSEIEDVLRRIDALSDDQLEEALADHAQEGDGEDGSGEETVEEVGTGSGIPT